MFDKLASVEARYQEIESRLADPDMANQPSEFRKLSQEHAGLQELIAEYRRYKKLRADIASNKELVYEKDPEISDMAKEELKMLEPEIEQSSRALQILLLPKDPNDHKNVIFEVRAGAGGEEAALFVAEAFPAVPALLRAAGLESRASSRSIPRGWAE